MLRKGAAHCLEDVEALRIAGGSRSGGVCLEGLRLTAEWIGQPTYVESDCLNLIKALGNKDET
jgi:hypothetical protein